MDYIIEAKQIVKTYGKKRALGTFDFRATKGKVIGILGPNGSGKTTFFNILAGYIIPDAGEVRINQQIITPKQREFLAYMPDESNLYKWMAVKDALTFYKEFFLDFDKILAIERVTAAGIKLNDKIKALSKGMQEKLRLKLTLSRKAAIYLIDEPLLSFDLISRDKNVQMILDTIHPDATMIIATHIIDEMERVFDEVYFINDGKNVLNGECDMLRQEKGMSLVNIYREVYQ